MRATDSNESGRPFARHPWLRAGRAPLCAAALCVLCAASALPIAAGDQAADAPPQAAPALYYGIEHVEARAYSAVIDALLQYEREGTAALKAMTPEAPQYVDAIHPFVLNATTLEYVADGSGLHKIGDAEDGLAQANHAPEIVSDRIRVDGGVWLDYVSLNPDNGEREFKRAWLYEHDGYLFGAGYFLRDSLAKDVVHRAVEMYMREDDRAFDAITPDEVITTADLYAFVVNATVPDLPAVAHGISPELVGRSAVAAIGGTSDRPFGDVLKDLRRDGGTWVEYIYRNPDTYTDQLKRTWLYLHGDLIFASGYYLPDSRIQTLVESTVQLYESAGDDAFDAITPEEPALHVHPHLFVLNASTLETRAHGAFPHLVGTADAHLGRADVPLDAVMDALNADGHTFVKYLSENPATRTNQLTRVYLSVHDDLVFGAGYFFPDSRVVSLADEAIQVYKSHRDTVFESITAGNLTGGGLYPYVFNETHIVAHGAFPHHVGPIPTGNRAQLPNEPGKLIPLRVPLTETIRNAYEEGIAWGQTVLVHPDTGIEQVRRAMVQAYDGFVFGSGYYLMDADVQSVVDHAIFVYESNRESGVWVDIITPAAPVATDDLYPFVIDAASWTRLADGVVPDRVGKPETILDTSDRSVEDVLADLEANGGTWTTHVFHNPSTDTEQLKRTYLQLQDGLVFGSGYYVLDSMSQTAVHTAIMIYDQDSDDAIDQVNAVPDEPNPFYSFIVDSATGAVLAQGIDAGSGERSDWQAITRTLPAGDIVRELEANTGIWVAYEFEHPEGGEENKRAWLRLHDGLVFGSGYYESDALVGEWLGSGPGR